MKRFLFLIVLVMLVFWFMARHRGAHIRPAGPARYGNSPHYARHNDAKRRPFATARQQTRQALDQARQALDKARDEVRQVVDDVRGTLVSNDDPPNTPPPPPPPEREEADGLPVPIVRGTRVSEAQAQPPVPPRLVIETHYHAPPNPKAPAAVPSSAPVSSQSDTVTGLISATEERAKAEARRKLREKVVNWLDPQVPASWSPPPELLDAMVLKTRIKPVVSALLASTSGPDKNYGTLYEAELKFDASPERRAQLVELYNRELVERRLMTLGGTLAFILVCLGAVSGYIRTDEATKGYYTNRLRMLSAAGIGAAGVVIYHLVA